MEYCSDEEGEIIPDFVTEYYLVVEDNMPVSFASLPVMWDGDEAPSSSDNQVFLGGTWDNGLQKIYKPVTAWKFNLSSEKPEIFVLTHKSRNWIMLQKCRKSYEDTVRTVLITLHWLHYLKMLPDSSSKSTWNYLLKIFSTYDVAPSERDLLNHMKLISEAAKRDKDLASSKYFLAFMESPGTNVTFHEDIRMVKKSKFIVDEFEDEEYGVEEADEMEDSFFDTVCAICDNGGSLLCCEGNCLRSFHPTIDAGAASQCESLGFDDDAEVEAIQIFLCENCQYKQHQCFACGRLGSSDEFSGQEVFRCISATCGHFYHPECVAKLLCPSSRTQQEKAREQIVAGMPFTCPAHKCFVCKQDEDKNVKELQFAMCRRCPKAYHRTCLPRTILFPDESNIQRAWDGLLPNRILIYCLNHEIDRQLATPFRDHLIFPDTQGMGKKHSLKFLSAEKKAVASNTIVVCGIGTTVKKPKQVHNASCEVFYSDSIEKVSPNQEFDPSRKSFIVGLAGQSSKDNLLAASSRPSIADKNKLSSRKNSSALNRGSYPLKPKQPIISHSKIMNSVPDKLERKKVYGSLPVDTDIENRILALMKDSTSSFDVEEFMSRQKIPATYAGSFKTGLDKTMTLGLVQGSVKAVRTASQMLEKRCSIEFAKTVCEPEILIQLHKWKRKLRVYLAPFIHGMCYTSFGRHFTKNDKLAEIVDRLHWYVQNGDMIVDFSCGSNDFSSLMKEKLEKSGKSCSFKNYDLLQPKNDFCFEKRDWMSIKLDELPSGCQLIIGLNPPFGVKACLANKFINKALKFKPKLIVLIVPEETKRLDEKAAYDLIWEDDELLAGKSFYLPGSVDSHNQQLEQWNVNPPPLYLWSRHDWTAQHKAIAQSCGHISKEQAEMQGKNYDKKVDSLSFAESSHDRCIKVTDDYACGSFSGLFTSAPEEEKEGHFAHLGSSKGWTHNVNMKKQTHENPNDKQHEGGGQNDTVLPGTLDNEVPWQTGDMCMDTELPSPSNSMCIDMEISPISSPVNHVHLQTALTDNPTEAHKGGEMIDSVDELIDGYIRQLRSPDSEFFQFGSLPPAQNPGPGSLPHVHPDPANFAPQPKSTNANQKL